MTRKDFTLIAYSLALAEPTEDKQDAHAAWKRACESLGSMLAALNPRFDKRRFYAACSYDYWKNRTAPW
jgi:hypothetical protein